MSGPKKVFLGGFLVICLGLRFVSSAPRMVANSGASYLTPLIFDSDPTPLPKTEKVFDKPNIGATSPPTMAKPVKDARSYDGYSSRQTAKPASGILPYLVL